MVRAETERLDAGHLKITLTGPDVDRALTEFGLLSDRARQSRDYFWELPSWGRRLGLLDAGLILSLRAHQGGRDDSTSCCGPADDGA